MSKSQNQAVKTTDVYDDMGQYVGTSTVFYGSDGTINIIFTSCDSQYEQEIIFSQDGSSSVIRVEDGIQTVTDFDSASKFRKMKKIDAKDRLEEVEERIYLDDRTEVDRVAYFKDGTRMEVREVYVRRGDKPANWHYMQEYHFDHDGNRVTFLQCNRDGTVMRQDFSNGFCVKDLTLRPDGGVSLITKDPADVDSDGKCSLVYTFVDPEDPYVRLEKKYGKTEISPRDKDGRVLSCKEVAPTRLVNKNLVAWVEKLDIPTQSHPDRRGQRLATFSALFQPPTPAAPSSESAPRSDRQGGKSSR